MGSTGGWGDDEPSPGWGRAIDDYIKALPGRAMVGFGAEGNRLLALGRAGGKEQVRDMRGPGSFVDAYDDVRDSRYLPAAGNAALGVLDMAGGIGSKATAAKDAALTAWQVALKLRPTQVAEQAEQELKRILLLNKVKNPKPGSALQQNRIERANLLAERAVPTPKTPGGASTEEAQRMLDVAARTWPGNVLAGAGAAAAGPAGVMIDDIKEQFHPLHDLNKEVAAEKTTADRKRPFQEDAVPELAHYQQQRDEAARARNINIGLAGAESVGGAGATYGAMKTVPWAAHRASLGMVGLGADLAGIHPVLGLGAMAAGALPFAVPAGLGYASWKAANAIPDNIEYAHKNHDRAKLIDKIMDNYRDPSMQVGPAGEY